MSLATIPITWQAYVHYRSKDTSFKRAEVPVDTYPTYSFCLHPPDDYEKSKVELPFHDFVLGKTFNISYYTEGFWLEFISEGDKYNNVSGETLTVKLITNSLTRL